MTIAPFEFGDNVQGKPVVLIVEDERKQRQHLIEQLALLGIVPLVAETGHEAIRIASQSRPDYIVLDGLLPQMHGFEVARFIRAIDSRYRPRIAMLTGIYKGTRYQSEAKLKYGIETYLTKPVVMSQLEQLFAQPQAHH